jgi:hypothetical protein
MPHAKFFSMFRMSGHFQVFYLTHMLYFAYFVLLIFHAPDFWKWFVGPAGFTQIFPIFFIKRRLFNRLSLGNSKETLQSLNFEHVLKKALMTSSIAVLKIF